MTIKPALAYPVHPEFDELLNSCGSMTKQLEALGCNLSVNLLAEGIRGNYFYRYTQLCLKQIPVVIACSSTELKHTFFQQLLANANTTPIGKFLFATNSMVQRNPNMQIQQVTRPSISPPNLANYLPHNYLPQQLFWQRSSLFNYHHQQLQLVELILPEVEIFY